jgi:hypothetical protein
MRPVGIFSWWRTVNQVERYAALQPSRALASPFVGESHLTPAVVLDDIWQAKVQPVTRAEAMSVPAHARSRNLICTMLGRQPLRVYRDGAPIPEQPRWLSTSKYFPARLRMVWTIDDLAHYGWCLWVLDRGAADSSGRRPILDAYRVDPLRWKVDQGRIVITTAHGKTMELHDGDYLLIPGYSEGMLTAAADTIRGAKDLEHQWQARVKNPVPVTEIRYTGDEDLDEDEMRDIRTAYITARQDPEGTVMVTPRGFEVHPHGDSALELFVQGRNAVALDVARFWNLRASNADASNVNGSSVNYENLGLGRTDLADVTLRGWALPIEEALSQDDVLPAGQYVQFDLSALVIGPDTGTGPVLED